MANELEQQIQALPGPILVLGASGFLGSNFLRMLIKVRKDVVGTSSRPSAWRLEGLSEKNILTTDLLVEYNLCVLLNEVRPRTVFNFLGYGAYSFETDYALIYRTNLDLTASLLEKLRISGPVCYIHAGTSSEYGDLAAAPAEDIGRLPNSHYAVSKSAASDLIHYTGKKFGMACANLRLYSAYGPMEDSSRLIPTVVVKGLQGTYPPFVDPEISRDFVFVDDVSEAFIRAALYLKPENYGEAFNIGTGTKTSIRQLSELARDLYDIQAQPEFTTMANRAWDIKDWYANASKAQRLLGWTARTALREGLQATTRWYQDLEDKDRYRNSSKKLGVDEKHSVSAVIACYKDAQAIPIMYKRLKDVFERLNIGYEIIFVNDNSPDDSEAVICDLSARDRHVLGITHSRNFGSQAAFRSGMQAATKSAVVLLDGDLQDPPELIEPFVAKWHEGYEVVYGRRVKRQASLFMQVASKVFYRLFDRFSFIRIPHDAGDFALMDKKVVLSLLRFPERDLFMRGIRAFAGFNQTGVDYLRPERMFGVTTNSLLKNIGWAKKGILSFSHAPLDMMSFFGILLFLLSGLLAIVQVAFKLFYPSSTPRGLTTTLVVIIFFGSINLLAVSIIGEYIAKIFEEVKRRPHFIRRHIIRDGEIRDAASED